MSSRYAGTEAITLQRYAQAIESAGPRTLRRLTGARRSGDRCGGEDRYYHVFARGELEALLALDGTLVVERSGYDRDNWYAIAHKRV